MPSWKESSEYTTVNNQGDREIAWLFRSMPHLFPSKRPFHTPPCHVGDHQGVERRGMEETQ